MKPPNRVDLAFASRGNYTDEPTLRDLLAAGRKRKQEARCCADWIGWRKPGNVAERAADRRAFKGFFG